MRIKNINLRRWQLTVSAVFLILVLLVSGVTRNASATVPIVNLLVSVDSNEVQGTTTMSNASVSKDGRYVAFYTTSALETGDTNGIGDIYVRDMVNGTTARANVSSAGAQANGATNQIAKISSNGRYVAFQSAASNLVVSDTNGNTDDIFVRDLQSSSTELVSLGTNGLQTGTNSNNQYPVISRDGRFVVFRTSSNTLMGDGVAAGIVVRDRKLSTTTRLSISETGVVSAAGVPVSISCDGAHVTFTSNSSTLTPNDTNGVTDLFLVERIGGHKITNITQNTAAGSNSDGGVSCDGSKVVFSSGANNLVTGDTNNRVDIFTYDVLSGSVSRVSVSSAGAQADNSSEYPAISSNGSCVVFGSMATNIAGGNSLYKDIFLHNIAAGTTELVSTRPSMVAQGESNYPDISDDGKFITYASGDSLGLTDTNAQWDIFRSESGATDCGI